MQDNRTDSEANKQRNIEMSQQYDMQQAYIKATPEEKTNGKFFKEIALESVVDNDSITYA